MTAPVALTVLACAAATAAAVVGHHYRPAARARRRYAREMRALNQRRLQLEKQIAAEWARVRGHLAVRDPEALLWRLLADHDELHDLQALSARQRGGA